MTSLLTIAECRAQINSSKTDDELQSIIDQLEEMIEHRIGAYQNEAGTVTITQVVKGDDDHLFLKVPFVEIVSITEDGSLLDSDDYRTWGESGMVERLPEGSEFGTVCSVVYKPEDRRNERKQATINLLRLVLERTAMVSESIAGEYSFNAPDWDKAIKSELRNLSFPEV